MTISESVVARNFRSLLPGQPSSSSRDPWGPVGFLGAITFLVISSWMLAGKAQLAAATFADEASAPSGSQPADRQPAPQASQQKSVPQTKAQPPKQMPAVPPKAAKPQVPPPAPSPNPQPPAPEAAPAPTQNPPAQAPAAGQATPPAASAPGQQPGTEAAPPAPPPGPAPAQLTPTPGGGVSFRLENADLLQFVNLIATQLKMNYIVDPSVKGTVTISTAGNLRREDLFPVLQTVLKINGATAIQTGNFFRIVPLAQAAKTPVQVSGEGEGEKIPPDDRMMIQIIPLRFVFAGDMAKMLTPFLSDSGTVAVHEAGNILILMDTSLNVQRLMDIIAQFDSTSFARERIRLVPVQNNVASGLVPELQSIFAAYAMNEKNTPLRFIPLDRINSILVVTPDPSAFAEVEKWIEKLDQPAPPSGIQTFVYRVQNSEARYLAQLLTGVQRGETSGEAGAGLGGGESTGGAGGATGLGGTSRGMGTGIPTGAGTRQSAVAAEGAEPESASTETTRKGVHITVDPVNNALIIQCTPQQYAEIVKTLKELDVIPRQVMINARVYEVTLSGALSFGVSYLLQQRDNTQRKPLASFTAANALSGSVGTLIGQTRELLAFLNASENRQRVRVLSSPTILATDNSQAKIQVGSQIPILTSQGVVPVQTGGTSLFTNTITNIDTGIILTVTPRITSTGLVSLKVSQEISSAQPPPPGGIQSPSILKRVVTTQTVVGDGQTVARGGLISRTVNYTRNRIPLLGDIPGFGALFGSTSYNTDETELIVVITPHIIKSVQEAHDATRELQDKLVDVRKSFKRDKLLNP